MGGLSRPGIANAMNVHLKGESSVTANFIRNMDKFFDVMNVTNYTSCYKQFKKFKAPYQWSKDLRLEVNIFTISIDSIYQSFEIHAIVVTG